MRQLVIDRNIIRRNDLSGLTNESGVECILTDTFLVEMVKHPEKWAETVRRDLNALTQFNCQIRLSLSASEALRTEIRERRAITRDELLPLEFQSLLDELMQAAKVGSTRFALVQQRIADVLPALRAEQAAWDLPKAQAEDFVRKLKGLLRDQTLSDLRSGRLDGDAKLCLVADAALRAYEAHSLKQAEISLPTPSSMIFRLFILKVWRATWWLQYNGLDDAKATTLFNDSYDDEYILIASFFDGLVSNESRVKEASSALTRILECSSSDQLQVAFRHYTANSPS